MVGYFVMQLADGGWSLLLLSSAGPSSTKSSVIPGFRFEMRNERSPSHCKVEGLFI
jgi:hypothetical protein